MRSSKKAAQQLGPEDFIAERKRWTRCVDLGATKSMSPFHYFLPQLHQENLFRFIEFPPPFPPDSEEFFV